MYTNTQSRFSSEVIEAVWRKGQIVQGYDPNTWRQDSCRAWMNRGAYGEQSKYGWEIDHITPVAKGGSDQLSNLQPLQWENNRAKGDGPLRCVTTQNTQS